MKIIHLVFLVICCIFFSCNSEIKTKQETEKNKNVLFEIYKNEFIEKYKPIHDWDTIHFKYTYDYKQLFLDSLNSKFVIVKGIINDFNLSSSGIYYFSISQGYYPEITFLIKCTKNQFDKLRKLNRPEGVFVIKMFNIGKVWFDFEVLDEEISQSFSNDLISKDSLIDYKIIPF